MFRLLILLLLGYIGFRILKTVVAPRQPSVTKTARNEEDTVQDPVCKMYLAKQDAVVGTLNGKRHYFCSMGCLDKFRDQLDHKH